MYSMIYKWIMNEQSDRMDHMFSMTSDCQKKKKEIHFIFHGDLLVGCKYVGVDVFGIFIAFWKIFSKFFLLSPAIT